MRVVEIKDISFVNIPKYISISVLPISFSPKLDENKFNVINIDKSMLPKLTISSLLGNKITDVNVDDSVSIDITEPNVQDNLDIPLFDVPEFTLNEPKIVLPQTLSIDNVVLKSTGLNQNDGIGIVPENSIRGSVVQNLYSYAPQGGKIYIDFTDENISYGLNNFSTSQSNLGKQVMILNGTLNGTAMPRTSGNPNNSGLSVGQYALRDKFQSDSSVSSFITDLRNNDALISGTYNIKYSKATGANSSRIFTSINPAGLATNGYGGNERNVITKITKFDGTLNLSTSSNLTGSLVGFEHQLWDKYDVNVKDGKNNKNIPSHFYKSSAVLLNDGTINLGSKDNIGQDTNMIGFVVDIEQSQIYSNNVAEKISHKLINNGNLNMYGKNSVGISFESYGTEGILKYDAYLGKINMEGKNSYGLRMRNIFDLGTKDDIRKLDYFDNVLIIGNTKNNTIAIKDQDSNAENKTNNSTVSDINITNYTSQIKVQGEQNVGIMVGKSVSSSKNSNPISNFQNIDLLVDGTKNIGLLRDKNYSRNNTGDMIVNDSNFSNINFGANAKNSVLIRSEMYGITLDKNLDIKLNADQTDNVILQGVQQTWKKETSEKTYDMNSSGHITNNKNITASGNRLTAMMVNGTVDNNNILWQNGKDLGNSIATNNGTISLTGENNIGMAILNDTIGKNSGTISLTGEKGVGIFNEGTFSTKNNSKIEVIGNSSIGISNKNGTLNLDGLNLISSAESKNISEGSIGILSEGGSVNFTGSNNINTSNNGIVGIYAKGNSNTQLKGNVNVNNYKVGFLSESGELNINGDVSYNGNGFALLAKNDGKIKFSSNSSLTLLGNSYGFTINPNSIEQKNQIDFGGATINVNSSNVTVFNVIAANNQSFSTQSNGTSKLPGTQDLEKYVGKFNLHSNVANYKIASIDGGIINFNGSVSDNLEFLKKYKFQGNKVNISSNTEVQINNSDANTFFNGEVVGIALNSSPNIIQPKDSSDGIRNLTQLNISSNLIANRLELAPNRESTIGAYIDYGVINLNKNGNIVVEKSSNENGTTDVVNNNSIVIYAKGGSKVTTAQGSTIDVYGNNGIGIYSISTPNNKYGFLALPLDIENAGNINVFGDQGLGIYAENTNTTKGNVLNSGVITVNNASENSSIGIFSKNNSVTNTGTINVNGTTSAGKTNVGIYAENSDVHLGNSTIGLGKNTTGIIIKGTSSLDANIENTNNQNFTLTFTDLTKQFLEKDLIKINKNGIIYDNNANNTIDFNIDMSTVASGKAIIAKDSNITLNSGKEIKISGTNGKGVKITNGKLVNNGTITIDKTANNINLTPSVGIIASNNAGIIENSGTINILGTDGIGIYVKNANGNTNTLSNAGTINLSGKNSIGLLLKGVNYTFTGKEKLNFVQDNNSKGIIATNGTHLTFNKEFTSDIKGGNILAGALGKGTLITDNSNFTLDKNNAVGFFLKDGAQYQREDSSTKLTLKDGAIGIYSGIGSKNISNVNIDLATESPELASLGVVLDEDLGNIGKNVNGNIAFSGTQNDIGVVARSTNVDLSKGLNLNYNNGNGTGVFLENSNLVGNSIVNINGNSNSEGKNSIGIYVENSKKNQSTLGNLTLNINKDNTVGSYIKSGNLSFGGNINIGNNGNTVNNSTGILLTKENELNFTGNITLGNTSDSSGIVVEGGTLNNQGNIILTDNKYENIGVVLNSNSTFNGENGTIKIVNSGVNDKVGIGIYATGNNIKISNVGNFDLAKKNIAIYSDGANINSDINMFDPNNLDKNIETLGITARSKGYETLTIGGTTDKLMNMKLAQNSVGIIALDSDVKLQNLNIDMTLDNKKLTKANTTYGIVIGGEEKQDNNFYLDNININSFQGAGIALNTNMVNVDIKNSSFNFTSNKEDSYKGIAIVGQQGDTINLTNSIFTLNDSYGIYGNSSNITVNSGTFNLSGESNAIFGEKSGNIKIGKDVKVNLAEDSSGIFAYIETGYLTNDADIISNHYLSNFNAIIGKYPTKLTNNGTISLQGDKIFGIVTTNGSEIQNNGNISISGKQGYDPNIGFSFGIYSNGGKLINNGDITLGNSSVGIAYTGNTKHQVISSGKINITGQDNIGVLFNGESNGNSVNELSIAGITSKTNNNIGAYLHNYTINSVKFGDVTLGDSSNGVYLKNSNISNMTIDNLAVGNSSTGFIVLNGETPINTMINNVSIGNDSIGLYLENSKMNLTLNNMDNILNGKGSTLFSLKENSNLNLNITTDSLTLNNNIGFFLENGNTITSDKALKEIKVLDGGTGIVVKGNNNNYSSLINENTNIVVGSGSMLHDPDKGLLSVGAYFKDANDFENGKTLNFTFAQNDNSTTEYAVAGVLKNTFGTLTTSLNLHSGVKNSIGIIATNENQQGTVTLENKTGENLITVSGHDNTALIGQNVDMNTKGDIVIESSEQIASMGVSLTSKNSNNMYEGTGNIILTGTNIGINSVGYDVIQNGNIEIKGSQSVGISNVNKSSENKNLILNGNLKVNGLMSTGLFGYGSNIDAFGSSLDVGFLKIFKYFRNSIGIFSKGDGDVNVNYDNITLNGKNNIAVYKEIKEKDNENSNNLSDSVNIGVGQFNIVGRNFGVMTQNKTSGTIELNNDATFNIDNDGVGIYTIGKTNLSNNGNITLGDKSCGIYMAVSNYDNISNGKNNGDITINGNGTVGIQTSGYINFENKGNINLKDNGSGIGLYATSGSTISNEKEATIDVNGTNSFGMFAKYTADTDSTLVNYGQINVHDGIGMVAVDQKTLAVNSGTIDVFNKGVGMLASGKGATAINEGTISLKKDILFPESLIGMAAIKGGTIINDESGNINVQDGVGMYFDKDSTFENRGTITVKNGIGILGHGLTVNNGGKIIISGGGSSIKNDPNIDSDKLIPADIDGMFDKDGSLVVDTDKNLAIINDNFKNVGGVVESDYDVLLKNPTIDITKESLGVIAPHVNGSIKLDSNFALTGNGINYKFENFLPTNTKIDINASPLYDVDIKGDDVILTKNPYKDLTLGNQFDVRDDALDNILSQGGVDAEKLKEINSYLVGLDVSQVHSELDRIASGVGGNVYSNIQDRIGDINRTFKNSFEDMYYSKNLSPQNDKYNIITTTGKRKYKDTLSPSYDYNMIGLNYMKEWQNINRKYGYEAGFLVSKFDFKKSPSKEDVYSIAAGVHNYLSMPYDFGLFTRLSGGVNYHRTKNIVDFGNNSVRNRGNYMSYVATLENTLDYNFINKPDSKFATFIGSELQYSIFDTIKEKGDLALKVKSNDYFSNKVIGGIKGNTFTQLNENWYLKFRGDVKLAHEFENLKGNMASFKSASAQDWSLLHSPTSKDTVSLKGVIGLSKNKTFDVDVSFELIQDFKKDDRYWNVGLTVTIRFNDHKDLIDTLSSSTYYAFDKDNLTNEEKAKLKPLVNYLNNSKDEKTVYISGNTDSKGSEKYNDALSMRRAQSVKNLFEKEVTNDKVKYELVGNGELKPKFYNINGEYRAYNRRTDVTIK